jgi:hypothetical protein
VVGRQNRRYWIKVGMLAPPTLCRPWGDANKQTNKQAPSQPARALSLSVSVCASDPDCVSVSMHERVGARDCFSHIISPDMDLLKSEVSQPAPTHQRLPQYIRQGRTVS